MPPESATTPPYRPTILGSALRRGGARIAEALPYWQEAQDAFLEQFGRSAWSTLATNLDEIVDAARSISNADH